MFTKACEVLFPQRAPLSSPPDSHTAQQRDESEGVALSLAQEWGLQERDIMDAVTYQVSYFYFVLPLSF